MVKKLTKTVLLYLLILIPPQGQAKPRSPLPRDAFDGGIISAETLGRGRTIASNRGGPASGSENPAALASGFADSLYTTVAFEPSSSLPQGTVNQTDPLSGKVLHYLAIGASKGVLYYEPIGRLREQQIINPSSPSTDFRDIEFSANAIGFAGVDQFGQGGSFGISLAYLWSSLTSIDHQTGQINEVTSDTAEGMRLNFGLRYPTGAAMWGLVVQNAPAFLWGKDYRREMLPIRVRLGNSWRIREGLLFSFEGERRFYREGGDPENYVYAGGEYYVSKNIVLRGGAFGQHIDNSDDRHWTAGTTLVGATGARFSYALESYKIDQEKVRRSVLSVQIPFSANEKNN